MAFQVGKKLHKCQTGASWWVMEQSVDWLEQVECCRPVGAKIGNSGQGQ